MALQELAVYGFGLGIFLSIVCLVPSIYIERLWNKVNLLPHLWLRPKTYQTFEFVEDTNKVKESRLPTSWWTDEALYQLECRAIFSKVRPKHGSAEVLIDMQLAAMAVRYTCFTLPEAW